MRTVNFDDDQVLQTVLTTLRDTRNRFDDYVRNLNMKHSMYVKDEEARAYYAEESKKLTAAMVSVYKALDGNDE